ncbi:hypothetical protein [Jannaschia seohaensis]|uniref:hypothetical protein n=1 Tax=Jannaschia seohaensis TaxID=475081 RepID=UPI000D6CE5B8|nr:hypothetical protein [Jannaschia seohaensis]
MLQTIDAEGWRRVPNRPSTGPRIGVYGCSFVYGTGLTDEETVCGRLQAARPGLRILNRGIGGQGTVQNLLQMRRDIAAGAVDGVIFCSIADHRFRIVPHPSRMRAFQNGEWYRLGVEHVPVARHAPDGRLRIVYVPIWQPALGVADVSVFLPDDFLLIRTYTDVIAQARADATAAGLSFAAALLDRVQPEVSEAMLAATPDLLDATVPYDETHHLLPRDAHPAPLGAEKIADRLLSLVDRVTP